MWLNSWQDWPDFIERRRLVTRINLWRFMADVQSKFLSFGRSMILTTDKIIALEITKRIADQLHGSITSAKAALAAGGCSVLVITISNAPNPTDRAAAMSTTNLVSGAVLSTDKTRSIAAIAALDSAATVCPSSPLRGVDAMVFG